MHTEQWTIAGSDNEPILGNCHMPDGPAKGVVLIAHGFKGYKDYGMFPRIAQTLAQQGFIAHRFNFSHSGMTNDIATFARPELFERDTWNRQVHDLRAVLDAVACGALAGAGLPMVLFGHSRGGATVLLTAGRHAGDATPGRLRGVVTAAAPAGCCSLDEHQQRELLRQGWAVSPSSRTGQDLRVGAQWLQEQLDDPEAHDVQAAVGRIDCPMLFVHGGDDSSVPFAEAHLLAAAAGARGAVLGITGADHVFNTRNPFPDDAVPSEQLATLLEALCRFARQVCT
jgi:alpha-beta hydrolase superfamily lysophospholipase